MQYYNHYLRRANLNLVFTNYRPVSNLSYISKMIKRAVSDQIQVAAERSGNLEPLQSAYRVGHSTKTALLKVKSDFLKAIDKDEAVCLVMLDLSTAFDTVSHELLLNCLKFRFGIRDTALAWIKLYLSDRTQSVSIDNGNEITVTSDKASLSCGVHRGQFLALSYLPSTWVPWVISVELLTFYSTHMPMIHKIILASNLNKISLKEKCKHQLETCITQIRKWMKANLHKVNNSKTEFLVAGTKCNLDLTGEINIKVGEETIKRSESVWNLGIFLDSELKNTIHFNKLTSTLYLTIKNISKVQHLLDIETCKMLMQALVLSKLDYCNSTFADSKNTTYKTSNIFKTWHVEWYTTYANMTGSPYLCAIYTGWGYMNALNINWQSSCSSATMVQHRNICQT